MDTGDPPSIRVFRVDQFQMQGPGVFRSEP